MGIRVKIILHLRIKFEKHHEDQLLFPTKFKMHGPNGNYTITNVHFGNYLKAANSPDDDDDDGDRCLFSSERDCGNRFEWEISPVAGHHGVFTFRNPHTNNYLKLSWNEDEDADRTVRGNGADKGVEESCPERFWWKLEEQ